MRIDYHTSTRTTTTDSAEAPGEATRPLMTQTYPHASALSSRSPPPCSNRCKTNRMASPMNSLIFVKISLTALAFKLACLPPIQGSSEIREAGEAYFCRKHRNLSCFTVN